MLELIEEHKHKRIDIAGFGNYSVADVAMSILDGSVGDSYKYLVDCLREELSKFEKVKNESNCRNLKLVSSRN